jgi:uncharacterized damage-inducible protein DinB
MSVDLLEHYRQLVAYDEWANLEMIASLRHLATPPARSVNFMAHIVAAEHVWLARLLQKAPPFAVWPELSLARCDEEVPTLAAEWRKCLANGTVAALDKSISYKNSKGESWTSLVRDILTHVFMHSAYHRGQIAADMRQAGHVPAYTDFIHGVRQGLIE